MPKNDNGEGTRRLPCVLSADQRIERGSGLATALVALGELEDEKRRVTKQLGDRLKAHRQHLDDLGRAVSEGVEDREVTCRWTRDFRTGHLVCVRLDTDEEVDRRPLTDSERQMDLQDLIAQVSAQAEDEDTGALHNALLKVGRDVPESVIRAWSPDERAAAFRWATAVFAHESDATLEPPPVPAHVEAAAPTVNWMAALTPKGSPTRVAHAFTRDSAGNFPAACNADLAPADEATAQPATKCIKCERELDRRAAELAASDTEAEAETADGGDAGEEE